MKTGKRGKIAGTPTEISFFPDSLVVKHKLISPLVDILLLSKKNIPHHVIYLVGIVGTHLRITRFHIQNLLFISLARVRFYLDVTFACPIVSWHKLSILTMVRNSVNKLNGFIK